MELYQFVKSLPRNSFLELQKAVADYSAVFDASSKQIHDTIVRSPHVSKAALTNPSEALKSLTDAFPDMSPSVIEDAINGFRSLNEVLLTNM